MTKAAIPQSWTDGAACRVPDVPVHELFARQARRYPDVTAIRQWNQRLSYREVADSAADLAGRLKAAGVRAGARVGICLRRTPLLPVSELAVLMASATFVPLDPDQPGERLRAIADDAGIRIALADRAGAQSLNGIIGTIVDAEVHGAGRPSTPRDYGPGDPCDVAYIMYTSGSTGRPKGVMVSHHNLASFVSAINQHLGDGPGYHLAAFAAIGFDVSVFEFFAPLTCSSSIHLVSEAERADADLLQTFLREHRSSHVFLPPVLLPLLDPDGLPDLRALIVGGEPCDPRQVGRWAVSGRGFYNWYGPTEATVAVVGTRLTGQWSTALPIGRPLPGCRVYVLDEHMEICPPGATGELYIGGPQVALGYVSNSAEMAERFVPDPFGEVTKEHGRARLLYRTGDLAQFEEDGMISFLGRADRQLKIHGRRVEPAEIETALSGHPRVAQAVVDVSGSTIRAYVTPADAPSGEELREYCARWLPRQMVPATVVALAQLPLTVNAKVDFAALAGLSPAGGADLSDEADLGDEFERAVARGWSALFDVTRPRLDDDFFAVGGDSLSAMRLAVTLRRVTSRECSVEDVFTGRTVRGIAELLRGAGTAVTTVPSGFRAALSPAQRRIWFVEQFAPGLPLHNIVLSEQIAGALDVQVLERAFEHVARRQAALRWRLRPGHKLPAVTVADPASVTIPVDDLSVLALTERQAAVARLLDEEAQKPISLLGGPLWRVRLLRLADDEHVLIIVVHHIIFDGWSQKILYDELGQAYQQLLAGDDRADPGLPRVTFADYTAWTLDQAELADAAQIAWWREHLAGAPGVLDLPRDWPRPSVLSFGGAMSGVMVDPEVTTGVTELAANLGTTVGAVLLAAFSVLLRRLTGQTDMVVGAPVADRGHTDVEDLIGFFVRVVPLRLRADDQAEFADLVRRCGDELMVARQHGDVPLERIVEIVGGARDLTRNPLFQVMFNVYNFAEARLDLGAPDISPRHATVPGSHVDLTVYVILRGTTMRLEAAYNRDLYHAGRIASLLDSFTHLLAELVRAPKRIVGTASARPSASRLPDWTARLPRGVPATPGLLEQIRAIGRDRSDALAIEGANGSLTYGELLRVTDNIASAVRAAGVPAGHVVAVLAQRTAILPAVLLGVLSAGARWLVLDSCLPAPVMLRRLGAVSPRAVIWCDQDPMPECPGTWTPVIQAAEHAAAPAPAAEITDAAAALRGYLSLTSGTTGEPKPVRTSEAPLVHFLNWYRATFGLRAEDRFALLGGPAFDPLLREMFAPLTCGASLLVPAAECLMDPARLLAWLAEQEITVAHLTPQLLRTLTAGLRGSRGLGSMRLLALGGDQLSCADAAAARRLAPKARLLNCYGTTETPQVQAYYEIPAAAQTPPASGAAPVPVGSGIEGAQLIVLSVCGRPAAVGELGEVVIRSLHLSDGYLETTAGSGRYSPLPGSGEGGVFRTGDLGRYDPTGLVTLAGRADDQVKVRGYRVELGEVEAALRSHPDVVLAAVQRLDLQGESALHAFVTGVRARIDEQGILRHTRAQLPSYAVPSGITVLTDLPLTSSGKVDRAGLPRPRRAASIIGSASDTPRSDFERLVMSIWCEVLGLAWIASSKNFFEIGGHSMAIIEVQWRLTRALGWPVPVVDLFRFPTIATLAEHLASGATDTRLLDGDTRGRMRRLHRAARRRSHNPGQEAVDDER